MWWYLGGGVVLKMVRCHWAHGVSPRSHRVDKDAREMVRAHPVRVPHVVLRDTPIATHSHGEINPHPKTLGVVVINCIPF